MLMGEMMTCSGFRNNENPKLNYYYAMMAIRRCGEEGIAIPQDLLPYLNDACDALLHEHTSSHRTRATNDRWYSRIWDVKFLMMKQGFNKEQAMEIISDEERAKGKRCSFDALETAYKKHNRAATEEVELLFKGG